ncbi:MAG: hypothetical protein WC438_02585 [Candidatus Pacearchaeota archaeon]
MVIENLSQVNEVINILPTEVVASLDRLILFSQIAALIVIGYIIFLIIKSFYAWRRNRRIDIMYHKILEIHAKVFGKKVELKDKKVKKKR